jgi:hypothetical protein
MGIRVVCGSRCLSLRQLSMTKTIVNTMNTNGKKIGQKMRTSSLSRLPSSSNFLILSSYPAFSSRITVVSASASHHCSRTLRSSRTEDNSCSFPRTRISPDVSALAGPSPTSPVLTLVFPAKSNLGGDDVSFAIGSIARCLPFSFHDGLGSTPPSMTRSSHRPDTSPTDPARDRQGIGVGGGGRSGELDGPGRGTS